MIFIIITRFQYQSKNVCFELVIEKKVNHSVLQYRTEYATTEEMKKKIATNHGQSH